MKKTLLSIAFAATAFFVNAQEATLADTIYYTSASGEDSVVSIPYFIGEHKIAGDIATLKVPEGYKYFKPEQALAILEKVWNNPPGATTDGLLMKREINPVDANSWAVDISYDKSGYVKDDDAKDIDYDDLLDEMKEDTKKASEERVKEGYQTIELMGWASKPYYDEKDKKLHWAKEIKFGQDSVNTLNYNIRILGRKGVMVMNVIAGIDQLAMVEKELPSLLASTNFNSGETYSEFNPDIDQIAAYTVGGLIAGKVLAKVGLFAFFAKFAKVILIGIAAAGAAVWKFFTGRKKEEENKAV